MTEEVKSNTIKWKSGNLVLETRAGNTYTFEEQTDDILTKCREAATMSTTSRSGNTIEKLNDKVFYKKLIVKSCIEPQLTEETFDLGALKASEALALRNAMVKLYDIESFL